MDKKVALAAVQPLHQSEGRAIVGRRNLKANFIASYAQVEVLPANDLYFILCFLLKFSNDIKGFRLL